MKIAKSWSIFVSMVLVLCSQDTTARPHTRQTVPAANNPYDLGLIDQCVTPKLSACSKYVDYNVPGVVAQQVVIKEATIMAVYNQTKNEPQMNFDAEACAEAYLKMECRNQFPRCVEMENGQRHVSFTDESCSEITEKCTPSLASRLIQEGHCSLNSTVPIHQCKRVSEYTGYRFCNGVPGFDMWYITDWMHLYLMKVEMEIAAFQSTAFGQNEECVHRYTQFKCQSVGRCWDQGARAETISSQDTCGNVLKCYSSALSQSLERTLQCHTWPNESDRPSTPATPIIIVPTTAPPTTSSSETTETNPIVTFPTSNRISGSSSLRATLIHKLVISYLCLLLVGLLISE